MVNEDLIKKYILTDDYISFKRDIDKLRYNPEIIHTYFFMNVLEVINESHGKYVFDLLDLALDLSRNQNSEYNLYTGTAVKIFTRFIGENGRMDLLTKSLSHDILLGDEQVRKEWLSLVSLFAIKNHKNDFAKDLYNKYKNDIVFYKTLKFLEHIVQYSIASKNMDMFLFAIKNEDNYDKIGEYLSNFLLRVEIGKLRINDYEKFKEMVDYILKNKPMAINNKMLQSIYINYRESTTRYKFDNVEILYELMDDSHRSEFLVAGFLVNDLKIIECFWEGSNFEEVDGKLKNFEPSELLVKKKFDELRSIVLNNKIMDSVEVKESKKQVKLI